MSMGRGNTIVEFFSVEIVFKVCIRKLWLKVNETKLNRGKFRLGKKMLIIFLAQSIGIEELWVYRSPIQIIRRVSIKFWYSKIFMSSIFDETFEVNSMTSKIIQEKLWFINLMVYPVVIVIILKQNIV